MFFDQLEENWDPEKCSKNGSLPCEYDLVWCRFMFVCLVLPTFNIEILQIYFLWIVVSKHFVQKRSKIFVFLVFCIFLVFLCIFFSLASRFAFSLFLKTLVLPLKTTLKALLLRKICSKWSQFKVCFYLFVFFKKHKIIILIVIIVGGGSHYYENKFIFYYFTSFYANWSYVSRRQFCKNTSKI